MKLHIIYIPGLGDGYDPLRRLALFFWRRSFIAVTLVPMRWHDRDETYEEKTARVDKAIRKYDDRTVILVGESAGGAVAVACFHRFRAHIHQLVTVCGMNQGVGNVSPRLYRKNRAFRDAMLASDDAIPLLTATDKADVLTIYSSRDGVIGERDTLIAGTSSVDTKIPLHMFAIGYVLFVRPCLVIDRR
mgnify:CR=1 FL=1